MPIRSDRGRNATLRGLATWPLHSPRRLAGTAAVLALVCAGATLTIGATSPPSSANTASTSPSSTPRITVPAVSRSHAPTSSSARPVAAGDPQVVSQRFAEAWVSKLEPAAWRERLAPLCTEEFRATALPATEPSQITASAVTGEVTLVSTTGRSAEMAAPLDTIMAMALTLQDVTGNGDWRVADARPAR
jgi:hypothetical protein